MYTSLFIFSSFTQFLFFLLKCCNYSQYFSLQMSEKSEFIIWEKSKEIWKILKYNCDVLMITVIISYLNFLSVSLLKQSEIFSKICV